MGRSLVRAEQSRPRSGADEKRAIGVPATAMHNPLSDARMSWEGPA
jgi:hypothetical protein